MLSDPRVPPLMDRGGRQVPPDDGGVGWRLEDGDEWAVEDELLLAGLATGLTHVEVAALAGVSSKTVQRRVRDPRFAAEVRARKAARVERITGRLVELSERAVTVLESGLGDEAAPIRLRAADLVLGWSVRLRRESDLERRIAEIELGLAEPRTVAS